MTMTPTSAGEQEKPSRIIIHQDLKKAQSVSLADILKAMIITQRLREHIGDGLPNDLEQYGQRNFTAILKAAVDFCNGSESLSCRNKIIEALEERSEQERYEPLLSAFNSILVNFQSRQICDLQNRHCKDDCILVLNDPVIIKSRQVSQYSPLTATHKPHFLSLRLGALKRLFSHTTTEPSDSPSDDPPYYPPQGTEGHCENMSYKDWAMFASSNLAGKGGWNQCCKNARARDHLTWGDPAEVYEIKVSKITPITCFPTFEVDLESKQKVKASYPPAAPSRKAKRKSNRDPLPTKKLRLEAIVSPFAPSDATPASPSAPSDATHISLFTPCDETLASLRLDPLTQCGLYALELLGSGWDRTHSIVILLENEFLSLRWYDSQGCIETVPVEIVQNLPLLVSMLVLFQRFSDGMRGKAQFDLEADIDGQSVKYTIPEDTATRWELRGRRPVIYPQSPISSAFPKPFDDSIFKLSWREEACHSEGHIVKEARDRAINYLGDHANNVLDHLPTIKAYRDWPKLSTRHIRQFAGLSSEGSRVPNTMLSKRLQRLDELKVEDFSLVLWQLLRCHRLLWQIGIAHGDVSFHNIMWSSEGSGVVGVLNDYDLAAIMAPGDASPNKQGFERTGTKPFMALQLLYNHSGTIKRQWKHDFESFLWCTVWYCRKFDKWTKGTLQEVSKTKCGWLGRVGQEPLPTDIREGASHLWWPIFRAFIHKRNMEEGALDGIFYTDKDYVEKFEAMIPAPGSFNSWAWKDFRVDKASESDRVPQQVTQPLGGPLLVVE